MKKIISLIASLSLLIASMAVAPIASAADAPTLEVDAKRITDFTDYADYDFGEGYAAYLVTFNLTGLDLETVMGTGMAKTKANGTSLSSYAVQYTAEVNGDKDSEWVFDTLSAQGDKTLDTWNGKVHTFAYGNGSSMITPAKGTAAKYTKDDKIPVYTAILVMAEGETFKMSVNNTGCKINVSEFEKDAFKAGTRVESVLKVSDVTIPAATEPVLPAARTAISESFEAVVGDYVEITLKDKGTKTYALPSGVKGGSAKVAGMLKYTVNAEDANAPAKDDVFTVYVKNINDAKKANLILTETVK